MLGHGLGLVALQGADEMPLDGQVGQGLDFPQALLQVILAEGPLAGGMGGTQGFRRWVLLTASRETLPGGRPQAVSAAAIRRLTDSRALAIVST